MALKGPEPIKLPEVPADFPLPFWLHPFHYFEKGQSNSVGNPQRVEDCVDNICQVIPYLIPARFESFKRALTPLINKLFKTMNTALAENRPLNMLNDDARFQRILGAIRDLIKKNQRFAEENVVENIEKLAESDSHIANMLRSMSFFNQYHQPQEYEALMKTYADMRIKELSTMASYDAIARGNIPRLHLSEQEIGIMQSNDDCVFMLKYAELIGATIQLAFQSENMKKDLTARLTKEFMTFCKALESKTDVRIQYSDQGVEKELRKFIDNYYDNFKKLELYKFELIKLQNQLIITKGQLAQKQMDRLAYDKLELKRGELESSIEGNNKLLEKLTQEISAQTISLFQSIIIPPHREEFEKVCRLFRINPNELMQNASEQKSWLWGMMADSWLKRMGESIYSYIPSMSSMQQGLQTTAKYTGAMAAGSLFAGPLGMMAAPVVVQAAERVHETAKAALTSIKNTLFGEFTLKYQGDEYKVNRNMQAAFKDKADLVNNFYVQQLFDLDIALANMSEFDKKGELAQKLIKLYESLFENYQKIRNAQVSDTKDIFVLFSEAVKLVLQHDYQDSLRHTAESLIALRDFLGRYSEYESQVKPEDRRLEFRDASGVQVEEVTDEDEPPRASSSALVAHDSRLLQKRTPSSTSSALVKRASFREQQMVLHDPKTKSMAMTSQNALQAARESHLIGLSQKVESSEQLRVGTSRRVASLFTLGSVMYSRDINVAAVKMHSNAEYRVLAQSPLEMSLEDDIKKLVQEQNPGYLSFWFKEKCFTSLYNESILKRRAIVAAPLPSFDNKTLWHILCEHPDRLQLLKDIQNFHKEAKSATGWKFSDYFDLNAQYRGMNPLSYALKVGNIEIFLAYLEAIDSCKTYYTHKELKQCFGNILEAACGHNQEMLHNARLFCEQLMTDIALHKYSQQSFLGVATQYLSRMIMNPSDSTYMEIMSALTVRMAKGQAIPNSAEEIKAFLEDMSHPYSSCWHVSGLAGMDLDKTAKNVSQFIGGRSALFDYLKDSDQNRSDEEEQFAHLLINARTGSPLRHLTDDEQKLLVAILKGDHEQLKKLMLTASRSLPLMELTVEGLGTFNLLYMASCLGKAQVAATLYLAGTPVENCGPDDTKQTQKVSALVLAASEGHPSVLAAILDARAQARSAGYQRRVQDARGRTALHYLAEIGDSVCERWIASEADTRTAVGRYNFPAFCNLYDINGDSPLHLFANGREQHLVMMKRIDQWMRSKGYTKGIADIFIDATHNAFISKNQQGLTPLMIALRNKNPDSFAFLLTQMIESNCLEPVLNEVAERLYEMRELDLSFIIKLLIKESKEVYVRDRNVVNHAQSLSMYAKLAILAHDTQTLNLVLVDWLAFHKELAPGFRTKRAYVEPALEETLKLALEKSSLNDIPVIIPHLVLLAKHQGLDSHSKQMPTLLQNLKGQGVDDAKLHYLAERLFEEKLIPQAELEKYRSSTPPLISPESPAARRKLTIAFDKATQPADDLDSSLDVDSFVKIESSADSTESAKDKPPSPNKPDVKK